MNNPFDSVQVSVPAVAVSKEVAAQMLGMSVSAITDLINSRQLRIVRKHGSGAKSKAYNVLVSSIVEYAEENATYAVDAPPVEGLSNILTESAKTAKCRIKNVSNQKFVYTVAEAAALLSLSTGLVSGLIHTGKLKATQVGARPTFRITHQAILDYLHAEEYIAAPPVMSWRERMRTGAMLSQSIRQPVQEPATGKRKTRRDK